MPSSRSWTPNPRRLQAEEKLNRVLVELSRNWEIPRPESNTRGEIFFTRRSRSIEATALLIAGCVIMIGRVPVGDWLASQTVVSMGAWGERSLINFPYITDWLLNIPNAAAQRGIILGVILSWVAIAVRIIFGIERTYMGGGD